MDLFSRIGSLRIFREVNFANLAKILENRENLSHKLFLSLRYSKQVRDNLNRLSSSNASKYIEHLNQITISNKYGAGAGAVIVIDYLYHHVYK